MANNDLQDVRGSAVVQACGPGAVVDFRAVDGGLVSGIAAGLEEWDYSFSISGRRHRQIVHEPRLEKRLRVSGFRTPPVIDQRRSNNPDNRRLVAVRFPDWLLCPVCEALKPSMQWAEDPGNASLYCGTCTGQSGNRRKVYVVPARFVMACEHGHIDEFPWDWWVRHKDGCRREKRAKKGKHPGLRLRSVGPGHAGLILSCPTCKAERSMDGAFARDTWKKFITCNGRRPWLAGGRQKCDLVPHVVLRGASNLYFPVTMSALSIPPWSDHIQEALGDNWDTIRNIEDPSELRRFIFTLARGDLKGFLGLSGMTPEELSEAAWGRLSAYRKLPDGDLKTDEYQRFVKASIGRSRADDDFEIHREKTPTEISPWLSRVVRVCRLREVRAIMGFTRINPPGEIDDKKIAEISKSNLGWLPALEVRGEGIFLALSEERLSEWERRAEVIERVRECDQHHKSVWANRHGEDRPKSKEVTPRFMLCHTLAHALMRQLTLECGYSAASLRERIYAENNSQPMAGLLVYTATQDADGTLGGLERLGKAERIKAVLRHAIEAIEWCSSDPLCIGDVMGAKDSSSHSVCHACCLAPETSCEEFNNFLDRGLLIGTPDNPDLGFFRELITRER